MAMVMTTCLVMLDGMLAVGRHECAGGWSMSAGSGGVVILLVVAVVMMVAVGRRAIVLGRHVLR